MADTTLHSSCSPVRRARRLSLLDALLSLATLSRSRRQLAHLDDRMLSDIGVSRKEAAAESDRAPWDVPAHWLR